jgi:hypothetical protein
MEFLFNLRRLHMATSCARALAIIVASLISPGSTVGPRGKWCSPTPCAERGEHELGRSTVQRGSDIFTPADWLGHR